MVRAREEVVIFRKPKDVFGDGNSEFYSLSRILHTRQIPDEGGLLKSMV